MNQTLLIKELKDGLQKGHICSESESSRYTYDFSHTIRQTPDIVVRVTCEEDIVHCLRIANLYQIPLKIRGAGHTFNGQSLTDGGILVVNAMPACPEITWIDDELIQVPARVTWQYLNTWLAQRKRTVPVLTDYLELTVGGTLSVGGYGSHSVTWGSQADNVEQMKMILPVGDSVWCSKTSNNKELFRYGLGGLGQLGIIETAIIRTLPSKPLYHLYYYMYEDLPSLARSMKWGEQEGTPIPNIFHALRMGKEITAVYGLQYRVGGQLEYDRWHTQLMLPMLPVHDVFIPNYPLQLHNSQIAWMSQYTNHFSLWGDYFFAYEQLCDFAEFVETLVTNPDVVPYAWAVYTSAVNRQDPNSFPFVPSSVVGSSRFAYSMGVYFLVPKNDLNGVVIVQNAIMNLLGKCNELNGKPYLYGHYGSTLDVLHQFYGKAFAHQQQMRSGINPDGLINSLERKNSL